jgi:hypothetical protein
VWEPTANVDTVMLAAPVDEIGTVPNNVAPSLKLIVPVAVAPPDVSGVTLAVKVTGVPKAIELAVESISEVVVATGPPATGVLVSKIVGEVLLAKFESPAYVASTACIVPVPGTLTAVSTAVAVCVSWFSKMLTLAEPAFGSARSVMPSPLKSPRATSKGWRPTTIGDPGAPEKPPLPFPSSMITL